MKANLKREMKKEKKKGIQTQEKGITLIAFVITIIILLILVGVSVLVLTLIVKEPSNKENTNISISETATNEGEVTSSTENSPLAEEEMPYVPDGATVTEDDFDAGITIKDSNNNEWVWIVVPKSVTENAETDEEIEEALISYASDYRGGDSDTWYSGCGLEEDEYAQKYSTMLQSIKTNGGFYIGKYEVGSFDNPVTEEDTTRKAVIQAGAYPYNCVTCGQAEELAEGLATGGKTSTLMFGIQWDLVLKYLETSKQLTIDDLKNDSASWGNYNESNFDITQGKYSEHYGESYETITDSYTKQPYRSVLLTTGATERNSKMNIYDLAGNVWEWTLENNDSLTGTSCVRRGGYYSTNGTLNPASARDIDTPSNSSENVGFRPALY